jgi:hypothetical protein
MAPQIFKEFTAFFATGKYLTAFTRARLLSLSEQYQTISSPSRFLEGQF